jgi:origin recognition complex subunit 2
MIPGSGGRNGKRECHGHVHVTRRPPVTPSATVTMDSDNESSSHSSSSEEEQVPQTGSPSKRKGPAARKKSEKIIVTTSFDTYFIQNAARVQTSGNVFSALVPPLSSEEYHEGIERYLKQNEPKLSRIIQEPDRNALFLQMMWQLRAGFNILCYGYGSKREILNAFATEVCAKSGHVAVFYAFRPQFSLKEMLNSIETIPGISDEKLQSGTVEGQTLRILEFFSRSAKRDLYIIIHSIDSSALRQPRAKACLSLLANNTRIHIIASVDHINAPMLWSLSDSSTRKREYEDGRSLSP